MTDQTNDQQAEAPIFRLQKMYVKDLSFENPNAPEVFTVKQSEPKVEVNLGLKHKIVPGDSLYEVSLSITAKVTQGETAQTLFIIEVEHCAVFTIKHIPEQHVPVVLAVDCPSMMFPYTRQIISQLTVDGGFVPFLMEPVNFLALYQNQQRQATAQEKQQQQ
ncbi:MAG: protein-export chaperone SecB [Proteobacteria bacterium]|nr:protein-export chaperone SecB [Desulfobulbaceae bacterium]MBU4151831.1 protein-export chaperone SecB [Pseudomonadota bacterium]